MLDSAQTDLRNSFASGDFEATLNMVSGFEHKGIYEGKDAVLLNLEMGSANHFAGNYSESNLYFEQAEYQIEDLYTKSISRAIKSFLINDNQLAYDGEDYEDVYLNAFKTLNYIHLGDLEGALVESRRMSYKLGQLNIRYNGLVEALSEADTSSTDPNKWTTGETNIRNSSLGHYLSTLLYAKTGKQDDARISYNNLIRSLDDQPAPRWDNPPTRKELSQLTQPGTYNVLINVFSGRSPQKYQNDTRYYFDEIDTYLKFSLPELELFRSRVTSVQISVNGEESFQIPVIEHMDLVAREVYTVKEPIIYARTIVRASLKAIATNSASNEVKEKNEALGRMINFFGKIAQETTEKADLRGWQTMPGKAHVGVIQLTPGSHSVEIQYLSRSGKIIYSDVQEIEVDSEENLKLVESIYWN